MRDQRLNKMASVIVKYSLEVREGDLVLLIGELPGLPLVEAIYEELIIAGAHVKTTLLPPSFEEIFYAHASDAQLQHTSPFSLHDVAICDKRIRVMAPDNTRSLSNVSPEKQNKASKASQPLFTKMMSRAASGELNWLLTLFPTNGGAQEAEMGLLEYEDFVFGAGYLDKDDPVHYLKTLEKKQQKMVDYMQGKNELHFKTGAGTDLKVNVSGMKWINCSGKRNYPDGEIFTGPNLNAPDGGINGVVRYTFPAIWQNTVVENIELTFEKGRVVKATASKNEAFLKSIISQDKGASTLGEIAIGTNYGIKKFTKNILFDEKIGGTFHAALGMGYPETGNTNESALHWDMVCDLRKGGTIAVDGEIISREGKFVFPEWPN
jgi:aminopeptidase